MRNLTHDDAISSTRRRWLAWPAGVIAAIVSFGMTPHVHSTAMAADASGGVNAGLSHAAAKPTLSSSPGAFSHDVHASDLMSSDVSDSSGNAIGKAEDLLVDPATGRITAAVVDVKDFFGVSTRKVVIPVQDLKIAGTRRLITTLDKKQLLAQAPPAQ